MWRTRIVIFSAVYQEKWKPIPTLLIDKNWWLVLSRNFFYVSVQSSFFPLISVYVYAGNSITDDRHIRPDRHCSIVRQCDVHCCTSHTYIYIYFFLFFISFIPFMPQERKGPRGKEQSVAFRPFSLLHWWQARVLVVLHFRSKKSRFGYTSYSRDRTRRARRSRAQIYRPCKTGYVIFFYLIYAGP